MSTVQQDFKRRLARAEIAASAVHAADRQAASDRRSLRTSVAICEQIRERFLLMGLDPALAVSLRVGEEAAAKLARSRIRKRYGRLMRRSRIAIWMMMARHVAPIPPPGGPRTMQK